MKTHANVLKLFSFCLVATCHLIATQQASPPSYILRPADAISHRILQEPDMSESLRIDNDGTAIFPLIGKVQIAGMTIEEARSYLTELYDRDYFVNPQVSIVVTDFAPREVQVLGQVNSPGPVLMPHDRNISIIEAVAAATGQTRLANLRKVMVKRAGQDGNSMQTFEFDVQEMITARQAETFMLQSGDIVYVPERIF